MTTIFSASDIAILRAPHVSRVWFAEIDLPSGIAYLHAGVGRVTIGGHEWTGVTDPVGGQLVALQQIEEPRFPQAPSVQITIAGVNLAFFKSVRTDFHSIEGRTCNLYWTMFDPETAQYASSLKRLFPGYLSAPTMTWQGVGTRVITIGVESFWQAKGFPFGGHWNNADQQRRYPGDKGLEYMGISVNENWK